MAARGEITKKYAHRQALGTTKPSHILRSSIPVRTAMHGLPPGPGFYELDTVRGIIDRGRPYSFRHRAAEAYLSGDWPSI